MPKQKKRKIFLYKRPSSLPKNPLDSNQKLSLLSNEQKCSCITETLLLETISEITRDLLLQELLTMVPPPITLELNTNMVNNKTTRNKPSQEEIYSEIVKYKPKSSKTVVCSVNNIPIQWEDLKLLFGENWLNDQLINFHTVLMNTCTRFPKKVYCLNTFFYTKLMVNGKFNYSGVAKWTKNIDLSKFDRIIIPIHEIHHWKLIVINLEQQRFEYYDSFESNAITDLINVRNYWIEECKKRLIPLNKIHIWTFHIPKNIPKQSNSYDCGVFICQYMKRIAENMPFDFTQEDMPYFRMCMALSIVKQEMNY